MPSTPDSNSAAVTDERERHWNSAYLAKGETGVSWFEETPELSLELIAQTGAGRTSSLIDIGGGASRLVDALLLEGWKSVAVLDISQAAIETAQARLGKSAAQVDWIVSDVTRWMPVRSYDVWHDRAAFHFLTEPADREAYIDKLRSALAPGGHAIIATFAPDGPERCSGLSVMRYDPQALAETIGAAFEPVGSRRHVHTTPWGSRQAFQFSVLRRKPD
ncbi:SAM-dependent methyltransferase [Mesorhizobium sp. Root157]|uniref:class I SAM-dependent methyltransferase n=1 Tax=Mesorhizobium sp. Root157 TaxID=1736477 RepID=UPI0006FE5A96|nr:class I SAM-dependent methyltransferase [Mesorhizobium sp. Root157]KQZ97786.1 SAM-dependent methyltransferase [Mesorhizobium sp. Root157]